MVLMAKNGAQLTPKVTEEFEIFNWVTFRFSKQDSLIICLGRVNYYLRIHFLFC